MDETPELIFKRILDHDVYWQEQDRDIDNTAKATVMGLLNMNVKERFNASSMKHHAFFEGVDWEHLLDRPAPFIPRPEDETDTTYFDGNSYMLYFH